ncbi:MAG TPA: TlpA disulfide reductase family protein [Thermoanaerobaculia bacterium]|jgi:cytochrome c biogenesis protein CcmG/thiol:disulfide interchange protein DsbE|nr:TlpA disulfide reductase family protein [Thermoanaerobaculia bacterium]
MRPRSLGFLLGSVILTSLFLPAAFGAGAGRTAPDFTLPTASGPLSLHDQRGKVVYLDFWASWCAPCRESFPWMSSMYAQYSKEGLVIVAVNLDKQRDLAESFLQDFPAEFPVAFDPEGKIPEAYGVQAMPTSFIIGRDGKIVSTHQGFESDRAKELEHQIKEALAR